MKRFLASIFLSASFICPILASNLPIKCPSCGKMMVPGTIHRCKQDGN